MGHQIAWRQARPDDGIEHVELWQDLTYGGSQSSTPSSTSIPSSNGVNALVQEQMAKTVSAVTG
jgi:hypothetical protein